MKRMLTTANRSTELKYERTKNITLPKFLKINEICLLECRTVDAAFETATPTL